MIHVFGPGSKARQVGLDPRLNRVLDRAIGISDVDFMIMEGLRSDKQCYINFGKGRTPAQCLQGGCPVKYSQPHAIKVTWLAHALSSNHRKKPNGFGGAVDVYPYPVTLVLGHKNPNDYLHLFDSIAKAMFAAAAIEKVKIRWGADWNLNNMPRERGETDNPHFEVKD